MGSRTTGILHLVGALCALTLALISGAAESAPYQWRNLTIYIGTTTGGTYDLGGRLLALYIGKYLPGHPTVTPENRPGAGGLSLMNQMYGGGAKDGTELAILSPGFIVDHVIYGDKSNAQFESSKFNWIGSVSDDPSVFFTWRTKGVTLDQIFAGRPIVVGMPGPGGGPWFYSRALNALMGAKMKVISGYPGMAQVLLSVEAGELDGVAGTTWSNLKVSKPGWIASNAISLLVQYTKKRLPDLPNVPTIGEFVKDPQTAAIFDFGEQLDQIKYPVFAPPGVPADRVADLREAFEKATADPQFRADAARLRMPLDPMPGTQLADIVTKITNPPDAIVRRLREIYAN